MTDESGFTYNGQDPIFDLTKEEFEEMLMEFDIELEHPKDLMGHSLYMWRAKWVYRISKKHPDAFEQEQEKIDLFKDMLV